MEPKREEKKPWEPVFRRWAVWILASVCLPAGVHATNGMDMVGYSAESKAMAGAGAASCKDPAWSIINPAGIVDLDRRVDIMLSAYYIERGLEPRGIASNWFNRKMTDRMPLGGPDFGVVWPTQYFTFGTGFYVMAGLTTNFEHSRSIVPALLGQNWDRRLQLFAARIPLAFARDLGNGWAVGAALNINAQCMISDHLTLKFQQTKADFSWDDSYGAGLTLGVQKKWERFAIGASYATPQWMTRFKKYSDLFPRRLDMPQKVQAGVAVKIMPKLEVFLDYKWINWHGVPQFGREILQHGMGWNDQHIVRAALEYTLNDRWTFRTGISYGKPHVDKNHVFTNGLAPIIISTHVAAGCAYKINDHHEIHATYMCFVPNSMKEHGGGDILGWLGKGTRFSAEAHSLALAYTYFW
ncbi:MAG TPA: outer membrane protein transport protein [Candidatus Hydrogenedentes bacterium]|nr:outer membrane protein transport protein [Candidatus Hydrogenedentota bacterium]